MLLACNSFGQWRSDVWPSTNHYRFTDTNDYVNIKNRAETYKHFLYMYVTSQYALAEMNTNGFTYDSPDKDDWIDELKDDYYKGALSVVPTWYASSNNIISPTEFGSDTNIFYSWVVTSTNTSVSNPQSQMESNDTWSVTNTYTLGGTNLVTEIMYATYTNVMVDFDFFLDVKELWSLDTYDALDERRQAWNDTPTVRAADFEDPVAFREYHNPIYFRAPPVESSPFEYAGNRYNLIEFKDSIDDMPPYYINQDLLDSSNTLNSFFATNSDIVDATFTLDTFIDYIGCPTNYFDYTPFRNLNGSGYALGRIVTNSYIVTGTSAPPALITNNVEDYEGDARIIIGTNGQTVTLLSTNENIQSGFTELDYGWKYITNAVNALKYSYIEDNDHAWTTSEPYGVYPIRGVAHGYGTNDNPGTVFGREAWTNAYLNAVSNMTNFASTGAVYSIPQVICSGDFTPTQASSLGKGYYEAELTAIQSTNIVQTSTNLEYEVQLYLLTDVSGASRTNTFDAHELPILWGTNYTYSQGVYVVSSIKVDTDTNAVIQIGSSNKVPNQADYPGGVSADSTKRGFISDDTYPILIKYDWKFK